MVVVTVRHRSVLLVLTVITVLTLDHGAVVRCGAAVHQSIAYYAADILYCLVLDTTRHYTAPLCTTFAGMHRMYLESPSAPKTLI